MSRADTIAVERWRVQVWRDGICKFEEQFATREAAVAFFAGTASGIGGLKQLQHRKAGGSRFVTEDEYPRGGRR